MAPLISAYYEHAQTKILSMFVKLSLFVNMNYKCICYTPSLSTWTLLYYRPLVLLSKYSAQFFNNSFLVLFSLSAGRLYLCASRTASVYRCINS